MARGDFSAVKVRVNGQTEKKGDMPMRRGHKHCWFALLLALCGFASVARGGDGYRQTNLVSDIPGLATVTDPNLVNPWGLAVAQPTFLWVADNATGVSTLYDGSGHPAD